MADAMSRTNAAASSGSRVRESVSNSPPLYASYERVHQRPDVLVRLWMRDGEVRRDGRELGSNAVEIDAVGEATDHEQPTGVTTLTRRSRHL